MSRSNALMFRSRYDWIEPVVLDCSGDPGYTKQEFRDECDINTIMSKYLTTRELPPNLRVGSYGDFSTVGDFTDAQEILIRAREQFASLPSEVRRRFGNSPVEFLRFVADKSNYDEALKLGLLSQEATKRRMAEIDAAKVAAQPPPQK